ncbi:MAG: YwiC-like family protein [Acidobacteria bacterium]|nr:YwiC-like family protein [Acidobacteriota bacterium]
MSIRKQLNLPKEHGAWAMLYVPFVLGVLVASRLNLPVALLLVTVTALFISRESLLIWWRARQRGRSAPAAARLLLIYFAVACACGLTLLFGYRLWWLAPLGLFGLGLLTINGKQGAQLVDRSWQSEMLAIIGLTLTAPAAYYAASGLWNAQAIWLWVLAAVYFISSVFHIKYRVAALHPSRQAAAQVAERHCLTYHSFLLSALLLLWLTGSLPVFALIAFAPAIARAFWNLFKPAQPINLTRAGVFEIVYSLVFLVFIALAF